MPATPESFFPAEEAAKAAYREKLESLRFGKVPGGTRAGKQGKRAKPNPAWERGTKGERRVDGSFMPYLDKDLAPIGLKQWGEERHRYEANLAELRQTPKD